MRRTLALAALCGACLTTLTAPASAQTRMLSITGASGTVATAGVSQQVMPANPDRSWLLIQNPISAAGPLYVDFGIPASTTGGSIELAPGGQVSFIAVMVPTQSVNVTSATAGARFIAKQNGDR